MSEDAELLRIAGRGREAAFRELVDRHAGYVLRVARSLTGHDADAEDLVQETFLGALSGRYRGEASVRTWLVQILVRRAAMLRRKRRRHPEDELGEGEPEAAGGPGGVEARLDLAQMLASLTPEHREVVVLRELEGMSYDEMARTLGVPRGTVESRLHRARATLREKFQGYG